MDEVEVLQHVAANVARGYTPARGCGFQTVAISRELVDSEDRPLLEDLAAYYEVSAERRCSGSLPVKESLFRLPSGRMALTRTQDWGTGPSGRAGNYLSAQLVFPPGALEGCAWDPFALLDAAIEQGRLADLSARDLPPLRLHPVESACLPPMAQGAGRLAEVLEELLTGEGTILVVGPEGTARRLIAALFAVLPSQERDDLTFSTHFYRACHPHRSAFRLAAIESHGEAPADPSAYRIWDLASDTFEPGRPAGLYSRWLAAGLAAGRFEELRSARAAIDGLRAGLPVPLPAAPAACAAVWERAGSVMVPALLQNPGCLPEVLRASGAACSLADAILAVGSPEQLCGFQSQAEGAGECLAALRVAASPRSWRAWQHRWRSHPAVGALAGRRWAWWPW